LHQALLAGKNQEHKSRNEGNKKRQIARRKRVGKMARLDVLGIAREVFTVSDDNDPTEPQIVHILVHAPRGTTEVFSSITSLYLEFTDVKGNLVDHHLGEMKVTVLTTDIDSEFVVHIQITAFLSDRNFNHPWKGGGTVELLFLGPTQE
jgi:hypothetical protein